MALGYEGHCLTGSRRAEWGTTRLNAVIGSERQFQSKLYFSRITRSAGTGAQDRVECVRAFTERTGEAGERQEVVRVLEVRMVEGIEEFRPELQLHPLRYFEHFEQAKVRNLDTGPVEHARAAGTERSGCRDGKSCRIDEEPGCRELGVIRGCTRKRIADTVRVGVLCEPGVASVRRVDIERRSGLQVNNSVELPTADKDVGCTTGVQESFPFAKWQVPREIGDKAMANVQVGIALL